jgi:UDP-N-acetylglucosamine/UDP-N-acetylgalactosamine diphosphorylase
MRTAHFDRLEPIDQQHLLRFYDSLSPEQQATLDRHLNALEPAYIRDLADKQIKSKAIVALPADIKPVAAYPNKPDAQRRALYSDAEKRGHDLLRQGKVAAFLVAGGQGTRLGYDGPKGEFPVTPIRNKPLFQVFAEQLIAHSREYGRPIPWYIMTSDVNDAATKAFFAKHDYFGLNKKDVTFFVQGMMPAFALDGKLLLAERHSLALSPDGHGGSLRALDKSGALADMKQRGIEHLSYFQVDNPLVNVIDPLFIGLHDLTGSEMSSKAIPKASALEKVGNFVIGDGKLQVIEYSDLPESLAVQTNADGTLKFNTGSIGIHALRVEFIEALNAGGALKLPWHRAEKKVPFVDDDGNLIKPDQPNAVKLEQFVFDAIPLAKNAIVYTTVRADDLCPVKNAEGTDSPATSRRDQVRRHARWLQAAGVDIPHKNGEPDATIEISPLFAADCGQLARRDLSAVRVKPGQSLYLED